MSQVTKLILPIASCKMFGQNTSKSNSFDDMPYICMLSTTYLYYINISTQKRQIPTIRGQRKSGFLPMRKQRRRPAVIEQLLLYLYPTFQDSSFPLYLNRQVCVGPGQKPRRSIFSCRGSKTEVTTYPSLGFSRIDSKSDTESGYNPGVC